MTSQTLAQAVKLHQAGDFRRAEEVYRQILKADARHADAWHLLGVIALQECRFDEAVDCICRAIGLHPGAAIMHSNLGVAYKSQKRWVEAVASYRQALALQPDYAEAHYNLGLLLQQQGKRDEALAAFRLALQFKSDYADAYNSLGQTLRELGRPEEALAALNQALNLRPALAEAHVNLGNVLRDQKQLDAAMEHYEQALALRPDLAEAHNDLACLLQGRGKLAEAVEHLQEALRLKPNYVEAHGNLGLAYADQGKFSEAEASCRRALELDPTSAKAQVDLGNVLQRQGKPAEAKACFEAALRLQPSLASAHSSIGKVLWDEGQTERAQQCFEEAVRLDPRMVSGHYNLGLLLSTNQRKLAQAEECFRRAMELEPDNAMVHEALALVLADEGDCDEALKAFDRAQQLAPSDARKLKAAMVIPIILQSLEQMHELRRRIYDSVTRLLGEDLHIRDPLGLGSLSADFYVAYHGFNERAFRIDLARLYLKACPDLDYVAPHCRTPRPAPAEARIKIGFVSKLLRAHTIGRLNAGLIRTLDRSKFHVTLIRPHAQDDDIARSIDEGADRVVLSPDPRGLDAARRLIAEQELDVIFYPDIGMDAWGYLLAFARLAPVQCVTWGHPLTTGLPTMDYFISSEELDTPGAEEHYTERLVRLKDPAVYYYRPLLPLPAKDRAYFGLPQGAHLYGCLQTLFKFHPEYDAILAEILQRDPAGILVLIGGLRPHWNELLLRRFRRTMPDAIERIRFVPPQQHPEYLCLNALCHVILDPIHFGGGNTSYEALAVGVPVVTLPSAFLRGRITLALYRQMNLLDCVVASPEEYVDLAVRLGTDREFRAQMSIKIMAANSVLYENHAGVRQLEDFLVSAVAEARAGCGLKPVSSAPVPVPAAPEERADVP